MFSGTETNLGDFDCSTQLRKYSNLLSPSNVKDSQELNDLSGYGYSTDSQKIAPQRCYQTYVTAITDPSAVHMQSGSLSLSELKNELGLSASIKGGYSSFSANAQANYLREIEEKSYSISQHFLMHVTNIVKLQTRSDFIRDDSKQLYNDGKNKCFRVVCGDEYITSYTQGAALIMSLIIEFTESRSKETFKAEMGFK